MVRFYSKCFLVISFLVFSLAHSATVIPLRALCYKFETDCEKAGRILRSRSQHPLYTYVYSCVREQNSLELRTLVNCENNQWKLLAQLRSPWASKVLDQHLSKRPMLLRSSCYPYEYDARASIDLLYNGSGGPLSSVNSAYAIDAYARKLSSQEQLKYQNQECHDSRYLVEYSLRKKNI